VRKMDSMEPSLSSDEIKPLDGTTSGKISRYLIHTMKSCPKMFTEFQGTMQKGWMASP
jgi:hypothetical protein